VAWDESGDGGEGGGTGAPKFSRLNFMMLFHTDVPVLIKYERPKIFVLNRTSSYSNVSDGVP